MKRAFLLATVVASLVLLGGCATAPAQRDAMSYDAYHSGAASAAQTRAAEESAEPGAGDAGYVPPEVRQVATGTGQFINESAAARRPASSAAGEGAEAVFNFEGEALQAVIKAILGDLLQENYVIAPGVQGTVTFSTARPVRAEQAMSILEMLLSWNNAAMVWGDGRYTILPVDRAVSGNMTLRAGSLSNQRGYEVRAVPLRFISATEMEKLLKPYARPNAVVNVDNARNLLVLGGTRAELENYLQTVEIFDVDWLEGMSVGIFPLQQAEVSKVVGEMEKIFGEGSNTPLAGMFRFLPLEGVNSVLVITPQPRYLRTVEEWLERFDLGSGSAGQRLYVYDVKNVKAADLASTLNDIFGGGGGTRTTATRNPSGDPLMPGLQPVEVRTLGRGGQPEMPAQGQQASTRRGGSAGVQGGAASGDGGPVVDGSGGIALGAVEEVRISAVEESNALLVRATSAQWESIRRTIERLDTIPLQVHIEAQIIQVDLENSLNYGVRWFFEHGIPSGTETPGGFGANLRELAAARNSWSGIGGTTSGLGLDWTFVGHNAASILRILDRMTRVQILAAPSLVVLNNKSASINVGKQIPVTSSFINNPGSGQNFNQSYVQFRETGITLEVTPRVNPGGLVFMEITQTDSAPGSVDEAIGGNVPVDQRTISTEIAVQSGDTVILGGLIRQRDTKGSSGVPGVHRIPVLGGLFGSRNSGTDRQELLVLIKPVVIRDGEEARRITEDYRRQFRGLEPLNVIRPMPRQAVEVNQP
jgi:general secretion pathway protein D